MIEPPPDWLTQISVIGAGYVGLVTAVGLALRGWLVELVEVRSDRLGALLAGRVPIEEPGLAKAFTDVIQSGRLRVTDARSRTTADIVMLCVGTPIDDNGSADLSQLRAAIDSVALDVSRGAAMVVRSTMPVGSSGLLGDLVGDARPRTFLNPEFLRQGTAMADFERPVRTVIGHFEGADPAALDRVRQAVEMDDVPVLVVGMEEANIIKNGANAFLALKLSFVNELSVLCEEVGADVDDVLDGIGRDPRIGSSYMRPSFGFGGSCLPKELRTLATSGNDVGLPMFITDAASAANASHQRRFADRIQGALPSEARARVAMFGLAFKAGTDDVRSSPALRVAELLLDRGVVVVGYDPAASANARMALPGLQVADTAAAALAGSHVVVIATDWPEFEALDWRALRSSMARPFVLDGRRLLDAAKMRRLGYEYEAIGSPLVDGTADARLAG
jgi:UDPglucose 6-dehydrogenase